MSNLDRSPPAELMCEPGQDAPAGPVVLPCRDVPLGGPRAMTVRRSLPQRTRSLIGAWCFVDHYGPGDVSLAGGMAVPGHPHTGLQTASWLFTGEVEHRDTTGTHALVRPGQLNLMTAGSGIAHSEYSTPATTVLHGAQLWIALPERPGSPLPGSRTMSRRSPTSAERRSWSSSAACSGRRRRSRRIRLWSGRGDPAGRALA